MPGPNPVIEKLRDFVPLSRPHSQPHFKMSDLMKELLKGVDGIHCHICKEMFSTDQFSPLAPNATVCGHDICVGCHKKLAKYNEKTKFYYYKCNLCTEAYNLHKIATVSRGFLAFLEEIDNWLSSKDYEPCGDGPSAFNKFLGRFAGMSCHECKKMLATDNSSLLAPARNYCGHFICRECDMIKRSPGTGQTGATVICGICKGKYAIITSHEVSYGFLSLLAELHKTLLEIWSQRYHKVECSKCTAEIPFHKARICSTCSGSDEGASPLCSECVLLDHRQTTHKIVFFSTIEKKNTLQMASSDMEIGKVKRDQMNAIHLENNKTIKSMLANIGKLHKFAKSSLDDNYYPVMRRLRAELHNFDENCKDHLEQIKRHSAKINETHRNIALILKESSGEPPCKKQREGKEVIDKCKESGKMSIIGPEFRD